ncbi:MAG: cupin domain-containing protein [Dehalococcoidia bacterium]
MVERVVERGREPEPEETITGFVYSWMEERTRLKAGGKVVIKEGEAPWEQTRQGFIKQYLHPKNWDQVGAPYWLMFLHHIPKQGGQHRHQGGLGLFVLEGRGYSVVDGTRFDWEEGDLIILPVKPEGCVHQHFNLDPEKPASWLALIFTPFWEAIGNEMEQKAFAPYYEGVEKQIAAPPPHVA